MIPSLTIRRVLVAACCFAFVGVVVGCSEPDMAPVQTSADELDQYLANNPDENYSSDDVAEEMTADTGEGEDETGAEGSGETDQ